MVNTCTKFIYTIKDCHPNLSNNIYTQFQHQINLLSIWYLYFFPFESKRNKIILNMMLLYILIEIIFKFYRCKFYEYFSMFSMTLPLFVILIIVTMSCYDMYRKAYSNFLNNIMYKIGLWYTL